MYAMCWCLRVYWTVLHNLFVRFYNNLIDCFYNNDCHLYCGCCCYYCAWLKQKCCCSCCRHCKLKNDTNFNTTQTTLNDNNERKDLHCQHEYVIVDDADANYIEIELRKIETESYYRTIDRLTAERLLEGREDGACLVRPFKEMDICIKYIVSIYAQHQYYHLFIRQIDGRERYAIGQSKQNERHFQSPCEIIEFYSSCPLLCTNKQSSQCVVLKPIVV